jgi:hypothetical protein
MCYQYYSITCVLPMLYNICVLPMASFCMCETGPQLCDAFIVLTLYMHVLIYMYICICAWSSGQSTSIQNQNFQHLLHNHQVSITPSNVYCKLFVSLMHRVIVLYNSHFKIEMLNVCLDNYLCIFEVVYECTLWIHILAHHNPRP